ncbi:MAG: hypothetical protein NTNFB02_34150 [Nitrospira sp.]
MLTIALGGATTIWLTVSHEVKAGPNDRLIQPVVQAGKPSPTSPVASPVAPRALLLPKFPAETALPPELIQTQRLNATPSPLQTFPNTFEGRMGKLNLFSRTNALPPAQAAPPEMQLPGRAMMPPNMPPRPTPTIQQLRGFLLAEPGGREMIEEAKRRGLHLSQLPSDGQSAFSLASLFRPGEAQAAEPFKAVFTAKDPKNSGLTFRGIWQFDPFRPVLDAGIHIESPQGKSWLVFNVTVPREGMYYVNVVGFMSNAKASLVKGGIVVKQFDYGSGANVYNHWSYVHLAPGSHNFYWYLERGTAEFMEVSVQEDA